MSSFGFNSRVLLFVLQVSSGSACMALFTSKSLALPELPSYKIVLLSVHFRPKNVTCTNCSLFHDPCFKVLEFSSSLTHLFFTSHFLRPQWKIPFICNNVLEAMLEGFLYSPYGIYLILKNQNQLCATIVWSLSKMYWSNKTHILALALILQVSCAVWQQCSHPHYWHNSFLYGKIETNQWGNLARSADSRACVAQHMTCVIPVVGPNAGI